MPRDISVFNHIADFTGKQSVAFKAGSDGSTMALQVCKLTACSNEDLPEV